MAESVESPLQVILVFDPDQTLTDHQAILIERLHNDPGIDLTGKVRGKVRRETPRFSLLARSGLALERAMVRQLILSYETGGARRILDALPVLDPKMGGEEADLAIVLGEYALMPNELAVARHGEWAVSFGGAARPDCVSIFPGLRAKPHIEVEITVRTAEAPSPKSLRRTRYSPKPGAVLSGAFVAEKSNLFVLHTIRLLADGLAPPATNEQILACPEPPGVADVLGYSRFFLTISFRKLSEKLRAQRNKARAFWRIAHGTGTITGFHPKTATELPARAHVMADPFLFEHGDDLWLFYEAMGADEGAAWIEAMRLSDATPEPSVVALKCAYHLSFPYVFRVGDQIFMLPETQQSKRLEIWRATDFPTGWVLHASAFEGQKLAESSLFQTDDGQWWLLTNRSDHHAFQDHSSELYLYAIDGPDLKSITPHPRNPVVFGADVARNAGALIRHEGRIYRPTQNNSFGIYGYGLNIMEVMRMDASGYEERLVRQFTPADKPGSTALHHLSIAGDRFVFDWGGND